MALFPSSMSEATVHTHNIWLVSVFTVNIVWMCILLGHF